MGREYVSASRIHSPCSRIGAPPQHNKSWLPSPFHCPHGIQPSCGEQAASETTSFPTTSRCPLSTGHKNIMSFVYREGTQKILEWGWSIVLPWNHPLDSCWIRITSYACKGMYFFFFLILRSFWKSFHTNRQKSSPTRNIVKIHTRGSEARSYSQTSKSQPSNETTQTPESKEPAEAVCSWDTL